MTPAGAQVPRALGPQSGSATFEAGGVAAATDVAAGPTAGELPPAAVHPAFFDKQVEIWVKLIAALVALAFVLVVLLILRD